MKRGISIAVPILIAVGLVVLFWTLVDGAKIDVLEPKGEVASAQRNLFLFATALSAIVVVPVFILLITFSIRYRASNKKARYTPEWGENRILEFVWWGIPIAIITILSMVIIQTSHSLDPYKVRSGGEPLKVQVVALRWKWLFIYPEQKVATLNQLPIPIDRPVAFDMSADAPMSAFWIPSLGSQVYAMNGMISKLNLKASEVGNYKGYTTNINGEGYAKMTFNTKVMPKGDFDSWVASALNSTDALNVKEYEKLSNPDSVTDERTYRLANAKLFESIAEKNGHSHSSHGSMH